MKPHLTPFILSKFKCFFHVQRELQRRRGRRKGCIKYTHHCFQWEYAPVSMCLEEGGSQEKWIVPSILSDLEWYFPILLFTLFIIVPWGCCLCLFPKPCPPTRKCWYDRYIMYLFICYMYIFALCMKRRNFSYQELIFQHYWGWYSL